MRLRAGDPRDLLRVEDDAVRHDDPRRVEDATRPRLHRVALLRPARAAVARAPPARPGSCAASARIRSASARGSQRGNRCSAIEELVEDRVRGEHRTACRCGLVHDLVRSAGAHVVDERVVRREQRRDLGARNGVSERDAPVELELADELLELRSMCPLLVGERRAVDVRARHRLPRAARPRPRRRAPSRSSSGRARAAASPRPRAAASTGTPRGRCRARSPAASSTEAGTSASPRSSPRSRRALPLAAAGSRASA